MTTTAMPEPTVAKWYVEFKAGKGAHLTWLAATLLPQQRLHVFENGVGSWYRLHLPLKSREGRGPKSLAIELPHGIDMPDHVGVREVEPVGPHAEDVKHEIPDHEGLRIPWR